MRMQSCEPMDDRTRRQIDAFCRVDLPDGYHRVLLWMFARSPIDNASLCATELGLPFSLVCDALEDPRVRAILDM